MQLLGVGYSTSFPTNKRKSLYYMTMPSFDIDAGAFSIAVALDSIQVLIGFVGDVSEHGLSSGRSGLVVISK
jgi:hypothetical protein